MRQPHLNPFLRENVLYKRRREHQSLLPVSMTTVKITGFLRYRIHFEPITEAGEFRSKVDRFGGNNDDGIGCFMCNARVILLGSDSTAQIKRMGKQTHIT